MLATHLKLKLEIGQNKIYSGFTLIEVMVALVVISLTLAAFIKVSTLQAKHLIYLQDKTYALWVAQDVTHELQSGKMAWSPNTRDLSGEMTVLKKNFEWRSQFEPTNDAQTLKSETTVNLKGSSPVLSRYSAYFSAQPSNETPLSQ